MTAPEFHKMGHKIQNACSLYSDGCQENCPGCITTLSQLSKRHVLNRPLSTPMVVKKTLSFCFSFFRDVACFSSCSLKLSLFGCVRLSCILSPINLMPSNTTKFKHGQKTQIWRKHGNTTNPKLGRYQNTGFTFMSVHL